MARINRCEGVINLLVEIKCVRTGEVVSYQEEVPWDEFDDFYFSEGNMSCDCNRYLHFKRAQEIREYEHHIQCTEGRYLLNVYDMDRNKLYFEFES